MINEKMKNFDLEQVVWALICKDLYQHKMPPLTEENSQFLWSGSQEVSLVMQKSNEGKAATMSNSNPN